MREKYVAVAESHLSGEECARRSEHGPGEEKYESLVPEMSGPVTAAD